MFNPARHIYPMMSLSTVFSTFLLLFSIIPLYLADYPPASAHGHSFYQAPGTGMLQGGAGGAGFDDYYNPSHNSSQYSPYIHGTSRCVEIPSSLRLCQNIGYSEMRLPNLLQHETMTEVQQQSSSWNQLLALQCHQDTQIFLCSLFAPVCLNQPIYPCRSLCESVRSGCEDRMLKYGYPWPDMLRCDQYPTDDQLCIQLRTDRTAEVDATCPECVTLTSYQDHVTSICQASFVMRVTISEMLVSGPDIKMITSRKRRILKSGSVPRKLLREAEIFIEGGTQCDCPPTESKGQKSLGGLSGGAKDKAFLVMGSKDVYGRLVVSRVVSIDKNNKDQKRALKQLKKTQTDTQSKGNKKGSEGAGKQDKMCSRSGGSDPYGPSVIVDSIKSRGASQGRDLSPRGEGVNKGGRNNQGNNNKGNKADSGRRNRNKNKQERGKRNREERGIGERKRNARSRREILRKIMRL